MAWKFGISTIDYPYINQNPKMKILQIFSKFLQNLKSPRVAYSYHNIPTSTFSQSEKMKYPHTFLHTLCGRSFSVSLVVSVKIVNDVQCKVQMMGVYLHYAGCGNMTTQVGLQQGGIRKKCKPNNKGPLKVGLSIIRPAQL